jgi:hypothetical protein
MLALLRGERRAEVGVEIEHSAGTEASADPALAPVAIG